MDSFHEPATYHPTTRREVEGQMFQALQLRYFLLSDMEKETRAAWIRDLMYAVDGMPERVEDIMKDKFYMLRQIFTFIEPYETAVPRELLAAFAASTQFYDVSRNMAQLADDYEGALAAPQTVADVLQLDGHISVSMLAVMRHDSWKQLAREDNEFMEANPDFDQHPFWPRATDRHLVRRRRCSRSSSKPWRAHPMYRDR